MSDELFEIIRRLSAPMTPVPSGVLPRLQPLPRIRAVLFDIYGTLMISGSGEVGTADAHEIPTAIQASLRAVGVDPLGLPDDAGPVSVIRAQHQQARDAGIDYPEVDLREVWRQWLQVRIERGQLSPQARKIDVSRLAVEYECRMNPVWPMPGCEAAIDALRSRFILGIVSNAQFFTPLLFPALLGRSLAEWGFSAEMQYFSYRYRYAKPSPRLFVEALETLSRSQIAPEQTVYIGNDMLNDIRVPASLGMRTVLFAGDLRSLRRRDGDPRVGACRPDAVITDLTQLPDCLT